MVRCLEALAARVPAAPEAAPVSFRTSNFATELVRSVLSYPLEQSATLAPTPRTSTGIWGRGSPQGMEVRRLAPTYAPPPDSAAEPRRGVAAGSEAALEVEWLLLLLVLLPFLAMLILLALDCIQGSRRPSPAPAAAEMSENRT